MRKSGNLPEFLNMTFSNFETRGDKSLEEALEEAKRFSCYYADKFLEEHPNVYEGGEDPETKKAEAEYEALIPSYDILTLVGGVGCGKTHLAIAIGRYVSKQGLNVKYYRTADLIDEISDIMREGDSVTEFLNRLYHCDLLILDDLGAEYGTDWAITKLEQIIDYRYLNDLDMVITTNALKGDLPARIVDRITDKRKARVVVIKTSSYRQLSQKR